MYIKEAQNNTNYSLKNHIGNLFVERNKPVIDIVNDYYPFGMLMPGRNLSTEDYRFGFNGKENLNDVKGNGKIQDYGMRTYDPRLGKFLSVDPITSKYPELTPFQFSSNSPISNIDIDGLEAWNVTRQWDPTDIEIFPLYTQVKIQEIKSGKVKDDCGNFALRILVGYAAENGLPLNLTNTSGKSYNSNSEKYSNVNQYLNDVRQNLQVVDLVQNTFNINQSETQAGDMTFLNYTINEGKAVNFNHAVIFAEYNITNPFQSIIVYGNLYSDGSGDLLKSSTRNWTRSSNYNDGLKNKFTIYSGDSNSRWSVLNPVNMAPKSNEAPPSEEICPDENDCTD